MSLKPPSEWRETAWLDSRRLADLLDVSIEFVRREVVRRIPEQCKRRVGRRWEFYGPAAVRSWLEPQLRREIEPRLRRELEGGYDELLEVDV
jgi:hypothetical protein